MDAVASKVLLEKFDGVLYGLVSHLFGLFGIRRPNDEAVDRAGIVDELSEARGSERSFEMLAYLGCERLIGLRADEENRPFDCSRVFLDQERRMSNASRLDAGR
jgi:hypothetical protein